MDRTNLIDLNHLLLILIHGRRLLVIEDSKRSNIFSGFLIFDRWLVPTPTLILLPGTRKRSGRGLDRDA